MLLASVSSAEIQVGDNVPQLIFRTLQGKLLFVNDYVGEPRMLNAAAERVPLMLVFFRSDEIMAEKWLPEMVEICRRDKIDCFFIAVDETPEDIEKFRKEHKVRAAFLLDKFGSSAEQLGMTPSSRFSRAPTALILRSDGQVHSVYRDFRPRAISDIIQAAKVNIAESEIF